MKLIVEEPESAALHDELADWSAEASLADLALVPMDDDVVAIARRLDPRELRSLGAIPLRPR